jgi:uncharacterized membrane protein
MPSRPNRYRFFGETVLHETLQNFFYRLARLWHCHQLPERSFFIRGRQLPLCARCTGVAVGVLVFPATQGYFSWYVSAGMVLIFLVDSITQLWGFRRSNNLLRFVTGVGFGSAVLTLVVGAWGCFSNIAL